ncbi:hypothetical protein L2E82_45459 [Cichorium intybus]|uniref:Uncharacterized protein n=1 Tax=Cichorium intybus TaxID=13427 RepID=A0ACB8ZSY4_CICIN|nr:hypothetical protein L2E82_45459 [Cichorium intybus]
MSKGTLEGSPCNPHPPRWPLACPSRGNPSSCSNTRDAAQELGASRRRSGSKKNPKIDDFTCLTQSNTTTRWVASQQALSLTSSARRAASYSSLSSVGIILFISGAKSWINVASNVVSCVMRSLT